MKRLEGQIQDIYLKNLSFHYLIWWLDHNCFYSLLLLGNVLMTVVSLSLSIDVEGVSSQEHLPYEHGIHTTRRPPNRPKVHPKKKKTLLRIAEWSMISLAVGARHLTLLRQRENLGYASTSSKETCNIVDKKYTKAARKASIRVVLQSGYIS